MSCNDLNICVCNMCRRVAILESIINNITTPSIKGVQATTINNKGKLLNDEDAIPFNNIITNQTSYVTLDTSTGVFTTTKAGNYFVSYYVNIDGTESKTEILFSINGINTQAVSAVQGQMSGFAILPLNAGDTISIKNVNGEIVALSGTDIQASITITNI